MSGSYNFVIEHVHESKLRSPKQAPKRALKKNKAHDPRLTHLPDLRCH